MSETLEDIIIIEESDAAGSDSLDKLESIKDEESRKKKKIIIFGAIAVILILIISIVVVLILKSSNNQPLTSMDFLEEKLDKNNTKPIQPSRLENMIAKANYLYSTGSKDEALSLYEQIAQYSEAISIYNLGVAQLKDGSYKLALETFKKAILNDEKRCVSAINAAVCSLHLKNQDDFRYYIDLAYAYLPKEKNSLLYSYYYALINYYNHNYLEALSALENPTSDEYPDIQKHLRAKINALYSNDYNAIEAMEKNFSVADSFSIALLYARVGEFALAQNHLAEAIMQNIEPVKSAIAQAFISLKQGNVAKGAKNLKNVTDMFPQEVYKPYPISVKLKESLFDPLKAQQSYRERITKEKIFNYQKIFYFSPYKIFNADKTISSIQKGNANIYINNISTAKRYLKKSASSSNVNQGIAKAIKKALSFELRVANEELQQLLLLQPKHSILQYNLALTYAQLGEMIKAHKHFLLSYHLDAKNYLSGVFAIMTAQLINKDNTKLKNILQDSMSLEDSNEETDLCNTLINISDDDILSTVDWLDNDYKQKPLYLALSTIIALNINRVDIAKKASHKLTILLPNDILPHMMYIDAHFEDLKPLKYAREVLNYLKVQKFDFNDLYFGPAITRYTYTQQKLITGNLFFLREQLKNVLATTTGNTHEITSTLALASLYDKAFEESYTLYNILIDELKVRDAYTLFLGAVASTAADHHANAIALLELSKMKDGNFLESRYALGLLYLEVGNNQGATIQLARVGNYGFNSQYFNFDIDIERLLIAKEQKTQQ
ncbi:MAG: hypothetical protein U9N33_01560 [Campylobacterota bacterium]|nr:hypothetical protein [Campylobacterota bacterium]